MTDSPAPVAAPPASSPASPLLAHFRRAAEGASGGGKGLRTGETWRTYRDVLSDAERVALTLLARSADLGGERVGLFAHPGAELVAGFFGILLAGGTVTVLSPLHPPAESIYVCQDARVRRTLVGAGLDDRAGELALLYPQDVVSLPAAIGSDRAGGLALPTIAADRPALQLYTSGTTGKPKGAVLTHGNLGVQQELLGRAWGMSAEDVLLHALPLHHMHGISIALLTAIGSGASVVLLERFDAMRVLAEMRQATVFMGVPTVYAKLVSTFAELPAPVRDEVSAGPRGLRLCTSGSAALPVTIGEAWRAISGQYPLERFGMTEVGVALSNPLEGDRRPGTVGQPLPTVDVKVVGEDGKTLPAGEVGELYVRGPSVFAGYFGRPEADAASFVPAGDGGGPWFRTGDTVSQAADGYVTILGRTSVDILKSGGYKLSALEIEAVLREHPAVDDVAVVGVPDPTWGERVVAAVIARPGREAECDGELLAAFARERLAAYKVPRTWFVVTELPRTAVGKVKKKELAAELAARVKP
jgi:malonyl-CoA/methylmalonyl-CoA synthetase